MEFVSARRLLDVQRSEIEMGGSSTVRLLTADEADSRAVKLTVARQQHSDSERV